MRERIRVNDLTTLFVCPSDNWGTLERRALQDCNFFRDMGGNPILFCLKDSCIDLEAEEYDLPRIYLKSRRIKRFIDLKFVRDIRNILKENRFDIVHCYNLSYVWTISFLLMTNTKVPLLLTFNSFLKSKSKTIWQKWLFRRIDLVLAFTQSTKDIVQEYLPVKNRKIKIVGGGFELPNKSSKEKTELKTIGCYVCSDNDVKHIRTILYAMPSLLETVADLSITVKVKIFSQRSWDSFPSMDKIHGIVRELGLQDSVEFEKLDGRENMIRTTDVFIGLSFHEPFNDYELIATLLEKPVIAPRTASRQRLIEKYNSIGETYHFEDARELKDKIVKILLNEQVYTNYLDECHEDLEKLHGIDAYADRLLGFYERTYAKRLRLSEKVKKTP